MADYVHQEYPKWVDGPNGRVIVKDEKEEKQLLGLESKVAGKQPAAAQEEDGSSPLEVTKEHVYFLRSRGYEVKSVKAARIFMENLSAEELSNFMKEFDEYQKSEGDK